MAAEIVDGVSGCLLGLAVGDALGGPVELMSAEEIALRYGGSLREMVGGGWLHLAPGEYTDDTQLALCIADSIVARGRFDMEDVLHRFMAWYDSSPKDVGGITDSALSRMKRGMPWRDATYAAHLEHKGASAGNGALMRCPPIALLRYYDPNTLMVESRESARLTHWNDLCAHSAAALNLAIAALLQGSSLEVAFNAVATFLYRVAPDVVQTIETARRRELKPSTTGYVLDTLTIGWWTQIHSQSFEEAVTLAANMGGDADTQAAVAGALAGARFGASAIPMRWLGVLQHRARIEAQARRIHALAERGNKHH